MLAEFGALLRAIGSGRDPGIIPQPSEIIPTLEVGNARADLLYPQMIYRYCGWVNEGGAGGVRSNVALHNPSTSGAIAIVDHLAFRADDVLVELRVLEGSAALDDDGYEFAADGRIQYELGAMVRGRQSSCKVMSDQVAAAGSQLAAVLPMASDATYHYFIWQQPYVLLPGYSLIAFPNTDGVACLGTFVWTERRLDKEELRGVDPRAISV